MAGHRWTSAILVLLAAGVFYWRSARAHALTEKDSILVADFVNTTGDPVFDGTLKQALAVQLEQSPYLNLVPESKIQENLRYMGRPADERLTSDVAKEICLREGIKVEIAPAHTERIPFEVPRLQNGPTPKHADAI